MMLALMMRMFYLLTALRTFLQEMLLRLHSFQLFSRRRLVWLTCEISSVRLFLSKFDSSAACLSCPSGIRGRQMLCSKAPVMPWIRL